ITQVLRGYVANGWVSDGQPSMDPQAVEFTPAKDPRLVTLVDCGDSTKWTVRDKDTRERVDDGPHGRRENIATVERVKGSWKVTAFEPGKIGSC
ncbi:MAG: hypothetical protein ACRD0P_13045, partial [Stackebrandtia sp.]